MQDLRNVNHSFDVAVGDVGCTIRKGTKWTVPRGTLLRLMNCSAGHSGDCTPQTCTEEGLGSSIGFWVGKFRDIPENLLSIEHNKQARNMDVLKRMLEVGYGSITYEDLVTALIYERIK